MTKLRIVLYFPLLIIFSCSKSKTSFTDLKDFEKYINNPENGYINSFESSDFIVEAKMEPAINEEKDATFLVHLRISRIDGESVLKSVSSNANDLMALENYLSFDIMNDTYMENGADFIPAVFHHYEHNYGLKPSIDIFFEFPHFVPAKSSDFVFRDKTFGIGMIKIPFEKKQFIVCHVKN